MDAAIKTLSNFEKTLCNSIQEGKAKGIRMTTTEELKDAISKAIEVMNKAQKEAA